MKKLYILAAIVAFTFNATAQFTDDFESYPNGPYFDADSGGHWSNWNQSSDPLLNIIVAGGNTTSGVKSGYIGANNGTGPDAVLLLGNQTSGDYTLQFQMFIASGKNGYFNIQGTIPGGPLSGVFNSGNIYFNQDNANPGMGVDQANNEAFSFPHDEFFTVEIYFDVDAATYQMSINGTSTSVTPFQADGTLGGIDFYSIDGDTEYFIDDIVFVQGTLGAEDFSADVFSVYPNPVQDVLNIKSATTVDSVVVYDILGKVVLQENPAKVSPSIDMSSLTSGAYLVKVTIGNASKTVKVLK